MEITSKGWLHSYAPNPHVHGRRISCNTSELPSRTSSVLLMVHLQCAGGGGGAFWAEVDRKPDSAAFIQNSGGMDTIFVLRSTHADPDYRRRPQDVDRPARRPEKQAHRIVLASSGTEGLPPKASSTHSNRPTSTITSLAGPYPLAQMLGLPS
jgi:hypothetical protein